MLPIMDVSRWQGSIDWDVVKASGLVSGVMLRTRRTLRKSHSKEDIMASTTYELHSRNRTISVNGARFHGKTVTKCHHFGNVPVMVRNAGQLPQPFWLGAAGGGSSCGATTVSART